MALTSEQVSVAFRDREYGEQITVKLDDGNLITGRLKKVDDPELDPVPGVLALGSIIVATGEAEQRIPFATVRAVSFPHDES